MGLYLLKFSTCLLIFLAFYKWMLEKENMHIFKRFYLLGALVLAIVIPLVTFTQYVEPTSSMVNISSQDILNTNDVIIAQTNTNYLSYTIWSIYAIGVGLFGLKFFRNLYQLNYRIKNNPKQRYNKFTHVLLKDLIVPHTFFNYIFFNKSKFEANEIPEEVFWHEQTHASQKHSLDVIFIEALQVLFWFNPLIYIIKHAIKLNHEFLADQGVLQKGIKTNTYQEIILAFSSNATQPQLANAINYSLIKKRFTVMKTQTTKQGIWLRSFILLPLLSLMLYSFSDTKIVEKELVLNEVNVASKAKEKSNLNEEEKAFVNLIQQKATKSQIKEYNRLAKKYNNMPKDEMRVKKSDVERLKYIYSIMSETQKKDAEPFPNIPPPPPEPKAPKVIEGKIIEVEAAIPPPPPPIPANATPEQRTKYKRVIAEYAKKYPESVTRRKSKSGEMIEEVEVPMNVLPPPPPPPVSDNATPEQKRKYEENIKKYKLAVAESRQNMAKVRELNNSERAQLRKVKEEYAVQMKASQEAKLARVAEIKQRQEKLKQEKLQRVVEREAIGEERRKELAKEKLKRVEERQVEMEKRQEKLKKEKLKHIEERKVLAEQKRELAIAARLKHQEERVKTAKARERNIRISPTAYIKEMTEKNAIFFYNGEEITAKKALQLSKRETIHIETPNVNSDTPKVYLSTKE